MTGTRDPDRMPLLRIRELKKTYGKFEALRGLTFDMREGEIISVLGPSGCGKSTLLQLVAGLSQPDGGEIRLNDRIIASERVMVPPEKRGLNMVFQDYALWPHMSVFDNIAYGLKRMRLSRPDIADRVGRLTRLLHLDGLEGRLPPQLSGGQQQRVAIARALATQPKLLLLDEPLSNLDMRLRVEMRAEMAYMFRQLGTSVFHVTHDPEEAFAMADRLLIMRDGQIDQIGSPRECFHRPASRWAASLLGAINWLEGAAARTANGTALRLATGTTIEGIAPGPQPADGDRAELLFRPDDVRVLADSPAAGMPAAGGVSVSVQYSTYEGSRYRTRLETDDGQSFYMLGEGSPCEPGARLTVSLPRESAFLYPVDEPPLA